MSTRVNVKHRSGWIGILLICIAAFPGTTATAGNLAGPVAVVERLHVALLTAMRQAETLGVKGRYRLLEPTIVSSFDFTKMVRIMTGRTTWREAGDGPRKNLVDAFSRFSVGNYAAQFNAFSGQSFVTVAKEKGPGKTMLVRTRIDQPNGKAVALTYVVHDKDGHWRIIDVLADAGISELARRRAEYRSVIKRDGIDGLITVLNRKADLLTAQ